MKRLKAIDLRVWMTPFLVILVALVPKASDPSVPERPLQAPDPRAVAAEQALSNWMSSGDPLVRPAFLGLADRPNGLEPGQFHLFAQPVPRANGGRSLLRDRRRPFGDQIARTAERYRLDRELLAALVEAESGFDASVVSSAGAKGLMQIMPETLADYGVRDPFDPVTNLDAGARYFRSLLQQFGGNVEMALAAYNAGPGVVERYRAVPPYRETRAFVRRVLALYGEYADPGASPAEATTILVSR